MGIAVHDFLLQHRDEILRSWETRVTSEDRGVELVGLALRDDVPPLLDALADWLEDLRQGRHDGRADPLQEPR